MSSSNTKAPSTIPKTGSNKKNKLQPETSNKLQEDESDMAANNNALDEPDGKPKPVAEMTSVEVEAYYDANNLVSKAHGIMTEYELDILERRGKILADRRQQAEIDGEKAALTKVRRIVEIYVNQYGRAQFLTQLLADNFSRLHRENVEPKVTITIQSGGVAVEIGFEDIQNAYNQRNNSQTMELNRLMGNLLTLIKTTANQRKVRESKVGSRDYTSMCSDITWKSVVDQLNQANAE